MTGGGSRPYRLFDSHDIAISQTDGGRWKCRYSRMGGGPEARGDTPADALRAFADVIENDDR